MIGAGGMMTPWPMGTPNVPPIITPIPGNVSGGSVPPVVGPQAPGGIPNGTPGAGAPGTVAGGAVGNGSPGSPGGKYAWSDEPINLGIIQLGFGTRVLKDIAIVTLGVVFFILGIVAMMEPDLESIGKTVIKNIPV